ncbi:MAG: hypothetical protein WBX38_07055 [Candidatus Sulfotelmatobacter sp.]
MAYDFATVLLDRVLVQFGVRVGPVKREILRYAWKNGYAQDDKVV